MKDPHEPVRHFVRTVLGCGCPDEVLQRIVLGRAELPAGLPRCERIDVGGRLLIYVLLATVFEARLDDLRQLLTAGRAERDRLGFNRFRLAIPAADPDGQRKAVEQLVTELAVDDDKLHAHLLEPEQLPHVLFDELAH